MTEQMLYEILVFAAGMTTLLTAGRLIAIGLEHRAGRPRDAREIVSRLDRLELASDDTAADVGRVATEQQFITQLLATRNSTSGS